MQSMPTGFSFPFSFALTWGRSRCFGFTWISLFPKIVNLSLCPDCAAQKEVKLTLNCVCCTRLLNDSFEFWEFAEYLILKVLYSKTINLSLLSRYAVFCNLHLKCNFSFNTWPLYILLKCPWADQQTPPTWWHHTQRWTIVERTQNTPCQVFH